LLTSSIDGVIRLWDMQSGKLLAEPTFKQEHHAPAVLSPGGDSLAVFSRSKLGYQVSVGSGAAAPLILPDDGQMKFANFFATAPTRIAWVRKRQ
jgi:hypothetical protein